VRREAAVEYSDLGYLLWGLTVELALGEPLAAALSRHVLAPLGLREVAAWPGTRPDVVLSRLDTDRETELAARRPWTVVLPPLGPPPLGVPQDGNARFLGRLAGHAGLFGTAADVFRLAVEWLEPGRVLTRGQVDSALSGRGDYALGWARRRVRGSAGPALGRCAFGHTGFTGTSVWIDPERRPSGQVRILLAHRTRPDSDFNRLRRAFHAL
jgi:CubicO group peptidase (beta-lactamase class C family)